MIGISVQINGLDALRSNFRAAPALTLKYLAAATRAAIFEVEKEAVDSNMQFRTPRAQRTGQLVARFGLQRRFENGGLRGTTGPTVRYAPYVYWGTRWSRPNKYMDRIAIAATPAVNKHFNKAAEEIVISLAK